MEKELQKIKNLLYSNSDISSNDTVSIVRCTKRKITKKETLDLWKTRMNASSGLGSQTINQWKKSINRLEQSGTALVSNYTLMINEKKTWVSTDESISEIFAIWGDVQLN